MKRGLAATGDDGEGDRKEAMAANVPLPLLLTPLLPLSDGDAAIAWLDEERGGVRRPVSPTAEAPKSPEKLRRKTGLDMGGSFLRATGHGARAIVRCEE